MKKLGLVVVSIASVCHAQYWGAHPKNRDIFANFMDFGVPGAPGILKGQPINFVISGYSTIQPHLHNLQYLLDQHAGKKDLYKVIDATTLGLSMVGNIGCPPNLSRLDPYKKVVAAMREGETNIVLANQSASGLLSPEGNCSAKDKDGITNLEDPRADKYAQYVNTFTTWLLEDGADKVYINSQTYYNGRPQGMCFQWWGMHKFFLNYAKKEVYPGPYPCGITEDFFPTGYSDDTHLVVDGPVAKLLTLSWYVTVAGEDAKEEVIRLYAEEINKTVKFPARDFVPTSSTHRLKPTAPISISRSGVSIQMDIGHTVQVWNLNGKEIFKVSGNSAASYSFPKGVPGIYLVNCKSKDVHFSSKVPLF